MKIPHITSIIKGAVARENLNSKTLSKMTGIPYATLQKRYRDPSAWRLYEIGAVMQAVNFKDSEILELGKEVMK